jgi:NAD(P)-dependent dehydrogenase (short-subunit alcohol dehydrogenase family)
MQAHDFAGQTVLVTGAGSGIGLETALAFAREGAAIVATDVDRHGLEALAKQLTGAGANCRIEMLDVSDEQAVNQLAQTLADDSALPDIVVNNAGIAYLNSFVNTDTDVWQRTFDVNVLGVVHGCRAFIKLWQKTGRPGHLVNVASAASYAPMPNISAYVASKYAVEGLSEVLAMELHGSNICVSCIHPGVINTSIVKHDERTSVSAEQAAQMQQHYLEKGSAPSVVADSIVTAVKRKQGNVYTGAGARVGAIAKRLLPRAWFRALLLQDAAKIGYLPAKKP